MNKAVVFTYKQLEKLIAKGPKSKTDEEIRKIFKFVHEITQIASVPELGLPPSEGMADGAPSVALT